MVILKQKKVQKRVDKSLKRVYNNSIRGEKVLHEIYTETLQLKHAQGYVNNLIDFQMERDALPIEEYLPHYLEWNDLTVPTNFTVEEMTQALSAVKHSKLIPYAHAFVKAEEFGINGLFLASLASLESGYGTSGKATRYNNLFGFGSFDDGRRGATFDSFEHSILYVGEYIANEYLDSSGKHYNGVSVEDVNEKYSSSSSWATKIRSIGNKYFENVK